MEVLPDGTDPEVVLSPSMAGGPRLSRTEKTSWRRGLPGPALRSPLIPFLLTAWIIVAHPKDAESQGPSTAAISGYVESVDGAPVDGTRVTILHAGTGFEVRSEVRHGRFLVRGLEPGGPYVISLERIGLQPAERRGLHLVLGEPLELRFVLVSTAIALEEVHVRQETDLPRANAHGGTGTAIPDALLSRLPSLNRNLYDFVVLAPQASTRIGLGAGISGGGVGFRFNSFLVNGVPERFPASNQPSEFAGGRTLPFDAVREYEILLAPFDTRYGGFSGVLVNAVTRSGGNRFKGSVFGLGRSDALARRAEHADADPHERLQYGFHLGGPLRRDRVHFFVAAEMQEHGAPAPGPFIGTRPEDGSVPEPVAPGDVQRLEEILEGWGLEAGSAGYLRNRNPLANGFGRIDVGLPERNSRAVLWLNGARVRSSDFSRPGQGSFPLSTHRMTRAVDVRTGALQFHTTLTRPGGGHHELLVSRRLAMAEARPAVRQPVVSVEVPGSGGGTTALVTGTPRQAQGSPARFSTTTLRDELVLPLGRGHVVALGFEAEWFRIESTGPLNAFGTWAFSSLDSLEAGLPQRFELTQYDPATWPALSGSHYTAYLGDRWRVGGRVSITSGLRAEVLTTSGRAPHNAEVDSVFGRRTDVGPGRRVHLSPRLGFTWDLGGTGESRIRGGTGVFTGRPPMAWLHAPLLNHGVGVGTLRCGTRPGDSGPPPPFNPDHRSPPSSCEDGSEEIHVPAPDVELVASGLGLPRTLRSVLAWDRQLPWGVVGTLEAVVTRNLSDFMFVNLNLEDPLGVDRDGRVMYGDILADGTARPMLRDTTFRSVIDLQNVSRNRSRQLSVRLERRFSRGIAGSGSYTHSRVRDVQTPLRISVPGTMNWASRAVSGRHDDTTPGISLNDITHRVVLAGTYGPLRGRRSVEVSLLYVGESGGPFTWVAWGQAGRGDLNADGASGNDPIYVPRDAWDPDEILFTGVSAEPGSDNSPTAQAGRVGRQRQLLHELIEGTRCLRRQRGMVMPRNSCREPWSHTTVASVRHRVPVGARALEIQVDVFNVLNLLRTDWGHRRVARPGLLEHVGQASDASGEQRPVFRLSETAPRWDTVSAQSAFQLQFGVRYRF
jgi:hypothetical protein